MKLAVQIMSTPKRGAMAPRLAYQVGPPAEVCWDPDPEGTPECWRTFRKAWMTDDDATHRLVLSDDAVPSKDLVPFTQRLARRYPQRAFALYVVRRAEGDKAQANGWTVFKLGPWLNAIGVMLPSTWGRLMCKWVDAHEDECPKTRYNRLSDDSSMNTWLKAVGLPLWGVVPCPLQHGCPAESQLGNNNATRVSDYFIGEDASALSIDISRSQAP